MNNVNLMVNGVRTISVKADVSSSTTSYSVRIMLSSITVGTTVSPVSISGNDMFIASGTGVLGTVNLATATPSPSATAINAGSLNQTLWSNNINIGLHASKLHGLTVKQIGSAPTNTLANAALYVDGVNVATSTINANNQFVFTLGTPLSLTTGSHFVEVRGDVIGGAYRNFYMSLEKAADLSVKDGQVQGGDVVSIAPTYQNSTLNNVNGGLITINNGTLTINQNPAFSNTTSLVSGATGSTLASWKFASFGEDVKVNSLAFMPTFTGLSAGTTLQNVGLYVNGGQVGSNATATSGSSLAFTNLGSNLTVTVGTPVVVELRGDVVSNNPAGTALTSGTVTFALSAGSSNAQGISSSQLTSTSTSGGQSLSIGSNVTFAATAGFSTSTKAPNTITPIKIGSFSLSAGGAEGLTVTSIAVTLPAGAGNTMQPANQLTNLTVQSGNTVIGTTIGNPVLTTANTFSTTTPVALGGSVVFDVYALFGSSSATLTVTPSMAITYRGTTSNLSTTTATVAGSQTTANPVVIAAGNVKVNTGLSLTSRAVVTSANFPIATYNFKSNGVSGGTIKDVTFTFPANTVTSITMNGKTVTASGTTATISNVGVTVPATADGVDVPVTVVLVCTGTVNGCTANSPVTVNLLMSTVTYYDGTTTQSITPTSGPATTVNHFIYASVPSFAVDTVQKTGLTLNTENKIGEVTITADPAGQIKVNNIAFNLATSGITSPVFSGARIADGTTTIPGSSVSSGCVSTGGACVMTLGTSPNGLAIGGSGSQSNSKTFSLYAVISGTPTASTVLTVSSSVTPGTTTWDDSVGGATAQTAANIANFPTGSYSIRQ